MKTIIYYELDIKIRNKKLQDILGDDWLLLNFETLERMENYLDGLYNKLKDEFHLTKCVKWSCKEENTPFNRNNYNNCADFIPDDGGNLGLHITARCKRIHITE